MGQKVLFLNFEDENSFFSNVYFSGNISGFWFFFGEAFCGWVKHVFPPAVECVSTHLFNQPEVSLFNNSWHLLKSNWYNI